MEDEVEIRVEVPVQSRSRTADTDRLQVRVTREISADIRQMCKIFGMTVTQFGGMLLWIGYKDFLRVVYPERVLDDDLISKLVSAIGKDTVEATIGRALIDGAKR
jgi:hypothetical protein